MARSIRGGEETMSDALTPIDQPGRPHVPRHDKSVPTRHDPIAVFCSYAREDEPHLRKLETHLAMLQRQGLISTYQIDQIPAGSQWQQEIEAHLQASSLILLLISGHYLASDYCYQVEMPLAIQRQQAGQAHVIPIIVSPCDWRHPPLDEYRALPLNEEPTSTWDDQDLVWTGVAAGIRRAIGDLPTLAPNAPRAA